MSHFKDNQNKLHFLEDDNFFYLLPSNCVKITNEEVQDIIKSQIVIAPSISPTIEELQNKIEILTTELISVKQKIGE